ncbi:alpha/beta fold hydrolase [Nonomuraea terrae]|uniref:alpha/beta fold hydrolase n=1 Tax=Nonomuraea terrae TaxID=2530383 RepID=UPI001CB713FD|nr:alpha/beta fold hydrolase [Nonomuraea terrae]
MVAVHHRYAQVRGRRLFYREAGPADAPAVVLLHGFPTSSFMLRGLVSALAGDYHVIAPDHLGFGLSDALFAPAGARAFADDVPSARQMIRPSFVPPPPIRALRDLTRYRVDLVNACTAEKNRVEKLLEDAQIKLSVVASSIFGVSGRAMLARSSPANATPPAWPNWPAAGCAPRSAASKRRSPVTSPTTTPSCCV